MGSMFGDEFRARFAAVQATPPQRSVRAYAHGTPERLALWQAHQNAAHVLPVVLQVAGGGGAFRASAVDLIPASSTCAMCIPDTPGQPSAVPCTAATL